MRDASHLQRTGASFLCQTSAGPAGNYCEDLPGLLLVGNLSLSLLDECERGGATKTIKSEPHL